ncbi:MAG: DUF4127 family protein [Negativicutes bacterium]|nr:DUF4127 family protein [Negativicutes bacterium]
MRTGRLAAVIIILLSGLIFGPLTPAGAATILFVPQDNRPVSCQYAAQTINWAGKDRVLLPPGELLAGFRRTADRQGLWSWLERNIGQADAAVVSADALLYGGLVESRKHSYELTGLLELAGRFRRLKEDNPSLPIYLYSTIMRSPHISNATVEPGYFGRYGEQIFRWGELNDKFDCGHISEREISELGRLTEQMPADVLSDWWQRRNKNFFVNQYLVNLCRDGYIDFFLLGRDDSWLYSQSSMEKRYIKQLVAQLGLGPERFATFNGADQLGLLLLIRAGNLLSHRMPFLYVLPAEGRGLDTIPSYQDENIGQTITDQILAAGGLPVRLVENADLVLAVYTAEDGSTGEANEASNRVRLPPPAMRRFADQLLAQIDTGKPVSLADISYANGADNSLMACLEKRDLLDGLAAYNGWNTASNSTGYAIAQGMASLDMSNLARRKMLSVRYLDDWAYQANVRQELYRSIVLMGEGSYTEVDDRNVEGINRRLTAELGKFADEHRTAFPFPPFTASLPWQRLFETDIQLTDEGAGPAS